MFAKRLSFISCISESTNMEKLKNITSVNNLENKEVDNLN